jgi:hypothetical protein
MIQCKALLLILYASACLSGGVASKRLYAAESSESSSSSSSSLAVLDDTNNDKEVVACSQDVVTYSSPVLVQFEGNLIPLSPQERNALEVTYLSAYNDQAFQNCDAPYFRRAVQVNLVNVTSVRSRMEAKPDRPGVVVPRLDLPPSIDSTNCLFDVTLECRDCPDPTHVSFVPPKFDIRQLELNNGVTAEQSSLVRSNRDPERDLFYIQAVQTEDRCVCSANGPRINRVPTESEFQDGLQQAIEDIPNNTTILDNVLGVQRVVELELIPCSAKERTISSWIIVQTSVDENQPFFTPADLSVMEATFVESYNGLALESCDGPYFRTVTGINVSVSDTPSVGRRLQTATSSSTTTTQKKKKSPLLSQKKALVFNVTMKCRDCPPDTSAFALTGNVGGSTTKPTTSTTTTGTKSNRALTEGLNKLVMNALQARQLQTNLTGQCYCPLHLSGNSISLADSSGAALTADNFGTALGSRIAVIQNESNGSALGSVSAVDGVAESDRYDCSQIQTSFSTTFLLNVDTNNAILTSDDASALEGTVETTYNILSFDSCDFPYFRRVSKVTLLPNIDEGANRLERRLQTQKNSTFLRNNTILKFNVSMDCQNCPPDTNAFSLVGNVGSSNRRRRRQQSMPALQSPFDFRGLQQLGGSVGCYCKSGTEPNPESITESAFQTAVFSAISEIQKQTGLLRWVNGLSEVIEAEGFSCPNAFSRYQQDVTIAFKGDPNALTETERQSLQNAFEKSYNRASFEVCDYPYFRSVIRTTLVTSQRRLQFDKRRLQQGNTADDTFLATFVVDYQCQCSEERSLFEGNVGSSRTMPPRNTNSSVTSSVNRTTTTTAGNRTNSRNNTRSLYSTNLQRKVQQVSSNLDACMCEANSNTINNGTQPALTRDSFLTQFNVVVEELVAQGVLVNVEGISPSELDGIL